MLPFLNRTPPPNRIAVATELVLNCLKPLGTIASAGEGIHKVYNHFAGESPERKEKAELRRLNIESLKQLEGTRIQQGELSQLKIRQLNEGRDVELREEEAELRRLKILRLKEGKEEESQLRHLKLEESKRRKKEVEWRKMEAKLCKLKIQQLQSPKSSEEEMELRRRKMEILQQPNEEESRLRKLEIKKLNSIPSAEENVLSNLQIKLIERQLREYDDAASARSRAEEAVERYRTAKLKCLERQAFGKKRKRGIDWEGGEGDSPTGRAGKKRRVGGGFADVPGNSGGGSGVPRGELVGDGSCGGIVVPVANPVTPVGNSSDGDGVGGNGTGDVAMGEDGIGVGVKEEGKRDIKTPVSRLQLLTPPDSRGLMSGSGFKSLKYKNLELEF